LSRRRQGLESAKRAAASWTPVEQRIAEEVKKRGEIFVALHPEFNDKLRRIAEALPDATPVFAPLKGLPRAVEKLSSKRQKFIEQFRVGNISGERLRHAINPQALAASLNDI